MTRLSLHLPHVPAPLRHADPRVFAAAAGAAALVGVGGWLWARARRPTAEELERRRRERLATMGRITDGSLVEARSLAGEESYAAEPEVLVYRYRLGGVVYESAQDVSRLGEQVRGYHIGDPVQVRYDPRNPTDSIILAETWTGLWRAEKTLV